MPPNCRDRLLLAAFRQQMLHFDKVLNFSAELGMFL
jgi:hypothetical protein